MRTLKAVRQHLRSYHLKSGVFHFYRGEHGPAADFLTRALNEEADQLSPADRRAALYYLVQTRIGAASSHEAAGKMDRAIEEYRRALIVMPQYPDVQLRLGAALAHSGRLEEAIGHFRKALEINPEYVQAQLRLGFVLLELERREEAAAEFRAAQASREAATRRNLEAAEKALDAGDDETATGIYQGAFLADLSRFKELLADGLNHLRAENWEDAVGSLEQAAELCPRFADVHNYLGVALAEQGLHAEGVECFLGSVKINPDYIVAWLNMAFTAFELDNIELARKALGEVLRREPENAPAQFLLAEIDAGVRREPDRQRNRVSGAVRDE